MEINKGYIIKVYNDCVKFKNEMLSGKLEIENLNEKVIYDGDEKPEFKGKEFNIFRYKEKDDSFDKLIWAFNELCISLNIEIPKEGYMLKDSNKICKIINELPYQFEWING